MSAFPPSPAASTCSEDLDAILAAAGPMSHFPTPPTRDYCIAVREPQPPPTDPTQDHYMHLSAVLGEAASINIAATPEDYLLVQDILIRAHLPLEVMAFAYNILLALQDEARPLPGNLAFVPADLLVTCALCLAVSYCYDEAWSHRYWSRQICDGLWTTKQIDKTTLDILTALDFRLLEFASSQQLDGAISQLLSVSTSPAGRSELRHCGGDSDGWGSRLNGFISGSWINGQITPEASPPRHADPAQMV